ncbi:protein trichome birefringence-like 4 [Phtheirospermum japonicum]|uniref:Protein trichome birefringence-like 4 n=1 Tax=Phtheirospermum japonicum TaxID=374723 RepID=A0A830DK73_9LAMI|nr:protein trichome birefringence-like 4 [Phtheirospermum japonicum]
MNNAHLSPYPWMMRALETEISRIKMLVFYLNITKMTDYRKKGTLRYSDNRLRRGKMSRFSKTAVIGASLECPIPVLVNSDQKNIIKHAICVLIH